MLIQSEMNTYKRIMSLDWKALVTAEHYPEDLEVNDYLRALIIRKDWKGLLDLANVSPPTFLKALHKAPVRKGIFMNFKAQDFVDLLIRTNEPTRVQILEIMIEMYDTNEKLISEAGQKILECQELSIFKISHKKELIAFLPAEQLKEKLFSLKELIYPNEFLSIRDITKRQSILKIIFEEFERCLNSSNDKSTEYKAHVMDYITYYANAWKTCQPLNKLMKEILSRVDLSKIKSNSFYRVFICQTPSSEEFNFNLFWTRKLITWEQITKAAIDILAEDAAKENIKNTNLEHLIVNIPYITSSQSINLMMALKSEASVNNPKAVAIFDRIGREYEKYAIEQVKAENLNMVQFINNYFVSCETNLVLFNSEKSLSIIRNVIQNVIDSKEDLIKGGIANYARILERLRSSVNYSLNFIDDDFFDKVLMEIVKSKELRTLDNLKLILDFRKLTNISIALNKDKFDEFGFLRKKFVTFPPLATSTTRKAEKIEFETLHPFEQALIASRLLGSKNESDANQARICYRGFLTKILLETAKKPELAKRAMGVYFRFCRMCIRDAPGDVASVCVNPYAINASLKAESKDIESILEILPSSYMMSVLNILMMNTHSNTLDAAVDEEAARLTSVIIPRIFETNNATNVNELDIWETETEEKREIITRKINEIEKVVCEEKFRTKVMKTIVNQRFCFPISIDLISFDAQEKLSPRPININAKAIYATLQTIYTMAQSFTPIEPNTAPSNKMVCISSIANVIKRRIISIASESHIKIPYKSGMKFQYKNCKLKLCESLAYILINLNINDQLSLLLKNEDIFTMLNFFENFNPSLTTYEYNNMVQKKPSKFEVEYTVSAEEDPAESWMKDIFRTAKKPNKGKLTQQFNETILNAAFDVDCEKEIELLRNDPKSFVFLCSFINNNVANCSKFNGNADLLSVLLKEVFVDLAIEDPKPTEENQYPNKADSLFSTEYQNIPVETVRRCGRRCGRRVVQNNTNKKNQKLAKIEDKRFTMNVSLIAKICSIMRLKLLKGKFNMDIFYDALNNFLQMSPEVIVQRIGTENPSNFSAQLVELIVSNIDFGNDNKSDDWAASFSKAHEIFARMLSVTVLAHPCICSIISKIVSCPNVELRRAIITGLQSITLQNKFAPILAFRTRVISWTLSPNLVGMPLPQTSIDYLQKVANNENNTIDICRTIASCIVYYFQFQAHLKCGPYQFDELFALLKTLNVPKFSLIKPHFCRLISNTSAQQLPNEDIIPMASLPLNQVYSPIGTVEMPYEGVWEGLREKICAEFVAPCILSHDDRVVQLGMKVITSLSTLKSITTIVAPRIVEIMDNYSVESSITISLEFAISFCLNVKNADFTAAKESLFNAFKRFSEKIASIANDELRGKWIGKENPRAFNAINSVYSTAKVAIERTLCKANTHEEIEYISNICNKLLEVSIPVDKIAVEVPTYSVFIKLIKVATFPRINDLFDVNDIRVLFEFIQYMINSLGTDYVSNDVVNCVYNIFLNKIKREDLEAALSIPDQIASQSVFLACAAKTFVQKNADEDFNEILPLISRYNVGKCININSNVVVDEGLYHKLSLSIYMRHN